MTINTSISKVRPRKLIKDFTPIKIDVPPFEGEAKVDSNIIASDTLRKLSDVLENDDFDGFIALFKREDCFWKDDLTLTFDKRTLRGTHDIRAAWQTLQPKRKAHNFRLDPKELGPPMFTRMSPNLAMLSIMCFFDMKAPAATAWMNLKLVPSKTADGSVQWYIWTMATGMRYLHSHPIQNLPRAPTAASENGIVGGQVDTHGLPTFKSSKPLDTVVVGASFAGISASIWLEAMGATFLTVDKAVRVGHHWDKERYSTLRIHHPKQMVSLPLLPPPAEMSKYPTASEVARYWCKAVEEFRLPVYSGVELVHAAWDSSAKLWSLKLRDQSNDKGAESTVQTRNIIMSDGFIIPFYHSPNIPSLKDHHLFRGDVIHSSRYRDPRPFAKHERVVVIGAGASGHDIAYDLVQNGGKKDVTIIQRSPTLIADLDLMEMFLTRMFNDTMPIPIADLNSNSSPMHFSNAMFANGMKMALAAREERNQELEAKGYRIDRAPNGIVAGFEHRGSGMYWDHVGVLKLVTEDKIKVTQGNAVGCTPDGLKLEDGRILPADLIIMATGFKQTSNSQRLVQSGILDESVASQLEDVGFAGVDDEGERPGFYTASGHPNLFFCSDAMAFLRYQSRLVAAQVVANVSHQFPEPYARPASHALVPASEGLASREP